MTANILKKWIGADILSCARALADRPYTLLFDSNRAAHPLNRHSILCWNPIETITAKNGTITLNNKTISKKDFFSFLQTRVDKLKSFPQDSGLPFVGGAAGYFGYDLGRQLESLPTQALDDMNMPDAMVGIYTNILTHDHATNESWLIGEPPPSKPPLPRGEGWGKGKFNWQTFKPDNEYLNDIQKIIDYIFAGEVYQVNLSRRFETMLPTNFNRFAHYEILRQINAAPFSAFMNFGDIALASTSPERFLHLQNGRVETRPIKGTLPASLPAATLQESVKDRAENTMIVDLLRNDLSKVCDFHSIKVPELCALETFEGLHHLVSTVTGILQNSKTACDLLRACFPGGSVTGAPKIRAMELIEQLEPTRRGAYCGALGYIGANGSMDTSIAIRTLIYANNKAYLQTGSGIVSDSIPQNELQESLDKAAKIFESFTPDKKDTAA